MTDNYKRVWILILMLRWMVTPTYGASDTILATNETLTQKPFLAAIPSCFLEFHNICIKQEKSLFAEMTRGITFVPDSIESQAEQALRLIIENGTVEANKFIDEVNIIFTQLQNCVNHARDVATHFVEKALRTDDFQRYVIAIRGKKVSMNWYELNSQVEHQINVTFNLNKTQCIGFAATENIKQAICILKASKESIDSFAKTDNFNEKALRSLTDSLS